MFDWAILEQFIWFQKNHERRDDYTAAQFPILCGDLFGFVGRLLNGQTRMATVLRTQHKEIARLAGVIDRLSSPEPFCKFRVVTPEADAEIAARMKFAADALAVPGDHKPIIIN